MDIKQELIGKLEEAVNSNDSEVTFTAEQVDKLIETVNDSIAKDGMIEDLQAKLKAKDDMVARLYTCIINKFIKENS